MGVDGNQSSTLAHVLLGCELRVSGLRILHLIQYATSQAPVDFGLMRILFCTVESGQNCG